MEEMEERVHNLESLLRDVVKGRIRTDFLMAELEKGHYIPTGSNELAQKMVDSYERRWETGCIQQRVSDSKIIPLAFGRRLSEMRDEMIDSEQEIVDLAIAFQRWGRVNGRITHTP
jgi:hypothetical protein